MTVFWVYIFDGSTTGMSWSFVPCAIQHRPCSMWLPCLPKTEGTSDTSLLARLWSDLWQYLNTGGSVRSMFRSICVKLQISSRKVPIFVSFPIIEEKTGKHDVSAHLYVISLCLGSLISKKICSQMSHNFYVSDHSTHICRPLIFPQKGLIMLCAKFYCCCVEFSNPLIAQS